MNHASLELYRFKYKLPTPLSIATHTWTHLESIVVKLHYGQFVGLGEATPLPIMTGETYDFVMSQLHQFKTCSIEPENFYHELQNNVSSTQARAALDAAFHDLLGKMNNKPVYKLFGNERNLTLNCLTLPVLDVEETRLFALKLLAKHPQVRQIKIKIDNTQINTDLAEVIKEVFAHNVSFVIDPNQCFNDSKEAVDILQEMQNILGTVVAIEQPVAKHDYQGLCDVKNKLTDINVYADESIVTIDDLETLIKMNAVDGINIKIQKAGGIKNAQLMARRADEAGLKVMVGCMMEGPIGIASGIHFATSTSNVVLTDLDSDLFLFQDLQKPVFSTSPFTHGKREPFERPGLGIEIHEAALEQAVKENELIFQQFL